MVAEPERIEPRDEPTHIGGIDYPDEVIRALLERRLVVFAGAGVSMACPSHLPNFDGLIKEFEHQTGRCRLDGESYDQYLGRNDIEHGVNVHGVVERRLNQGVPRPNSNHLNLLRLFGSADNVRLVTTNFDHMFEQACGPIGWSVESFVAPLLPTATDFKGIVHLHGSLEDHERMVLTDTDLGRAYLSEGWASRFLSELVRRYTVLFVGYSSRDLMPRYLLSAIRDASAGNLYLLHPSGEQQIAQQIGIHPIPYGPDSTVDHSVLTASVARLGTLFSQDLDEWRSLIGTTVAHADQVQPADEEIVRLALRVPATTGYFVNAADRILWVQWLDVNGYLAPIFTAGPQTQSVELLAHLVARQCIRDDPAYLLSLIERHRFVMSDRLWQQMIFAIRENKTDGVSLTQWVTVLLQQPLEHMEGFALGSLANACHSQGDASAALLLYEFLCAPRYIGSEYYPPGHSDHVVLTGVAIQPHGGNIAIRQCVDTLEVQDESVRRRMMEIGVRSFERRHQLLKVWGESTDACDPWSTVYDPINRNDEPGEIEGLDFVCDTTRRQIHSVANSGGDFADDLVRRLVAAPAPILRRLAVDAVRACDDKDPEAKAKWLMEQTEIEDLELVTEVSRLLTQTFADLSDASQERVVAWLLDGEARQETHEDNVSAKQSRWLRLLRRSDPNSKAVERELRLLRRRSQRAYAHPYPERPVSVGEAGIIQHPKPFSIDELLDAPAGAWVHDLLSWKRPRGWIWGDERHGLLTNVRLACVRNFGWSKDLSRDLIDRDNSSADLWGAILTAWQDESCSVVDWSSVLDALTFIGCRKDLSRDIAFVLVRFAKGAQGSDLFERSSQLAAAMWCKNSDDADGWMSNGALVASWNSAAGQIPMYWVEVARRLIDGSLESEPISTKLKSEVYEIVQSESQRATVGKATLGAWFHVLYRLDKDWAIEALVPMFGNSEDGFEAAWEGFLWTFQGTLWMPNEMLGHAKAAIANRQRIDTKRGLGVARFVSYLCCTRESEQAHDLFRLLCATAADAKSRGDDIADFVIGIRSMLRRMDVQRRTKLWNAWLREHLSHRRRGLPSGLVDGEVWKLLTLIPVVLPASREVVDVLIDFPTDKSESNTFGMIFHRVDVDDFPKEYAKLMLYFDQYELDHWQWGLNKEHVNKLIANESVPLDQRKKLEGLKLKYMID